MECARCIVCLRLLTHCSQSEAIKGITASKFTDVVTQVMLSVSAEALYHGNVDSGDAQAARDAILACLTASGGATLSPNQHPTEPVTQFPLQPEPFYAICPTKNVTGPSSEAGRIEAPS